MDVSDTEANQHIIYLTEVEHNRSEWSYDATTELLKIYNEKGDMLDSGIIPTHKILWELTSQAMMKKGFPYTAAQCENKWKALKRAYRTKMKRIQKFGSTKRPCPFEYEVSEILNKRLSARSYSVKIEKLKQEEDLFEINLNEPPGFTKDKTAEFNYANEKDIELLIEDGSLEHESENAEPTYTIVQDDSQNVLIEEIGELKRILVKCTKINKYTSKELLEVHENILNALARFVEGQAESRRIEERKAKQQEEIMQQLKLQNELMQKLLEKLS